MCHTLRGCVDWNRRHKRHNRLIIRVTPCVGVWIETNRVYNLTLMDKVTPCVGVWIETAQYAIANLCQESHLAWVCGLKLIFNNYLYHNHSHTLRGCVDWNTEGRGTAEFLYRHTLRGCVDWNPHDLKRTGVIAVTPCVGVWIETFLDLLLSYSRGHTLRGCVDWNPRPTGRSHHR